MNILVPIVSDKAVPEPNVPEGFSEPDAVEVYNFAGKDWTWNGSNVSLVRAFDARTVYEQLNVINAGYDKKMWRPVNAPELMQMVHKATDWPTHWKDHGAGGRIFFPGSIYKLVYSGGRRYEIIWYSYFDDQAEPHEWQFHCISTEAVIRPGDGFACVQHDAGDPIPTSTCIPRLAPGRRERQRNVPREMLAVTR